MSLIGLNLADLTIEQLEWMPLTLMSDWTRRGEKSFTVVSDRDCVDRLLVDSSSVDQEYRLAVLPLTGYRYFVRINSRRPVSWNPRWKVHGVRLDLFRVDTIGLTLPDGNGAVSAAVGLQVKGCYGFVRVDAQMNTAGRHDTLDSLRTD